VCPICGAPKSDFEKKRKNDYVLLPVWTDGKGSGMYQASVLS
jgi:hypothetical protein